MPDNYLRPAGEVRAVNSSPCRPNGRPGRRAKVQICRLQTTMWLPVFASISLHICPFTRFSFLLVEVPAEQGQGKSHSKNAQSNVPNNVHNIFLNLLLQSTIWLKCNGYLQAMISSRNIVIYCLKQC